MIVLYLKNNNQFLQAVKGFPELKEGANKLYIEVNGVWKVAINDLTKAGYKEYPDQGITIPRDEEGNELPITLAELNLRDFEALDLPTSQHLARIKSIDVTKAKPMTVTRTYQGIDFDIPCVVTQNIKDQYVEGKIQVGDIVIVAYCDERIDDAIVQSKVFKSW